MPICARPEGDIHYEDRGSGPSIVLAHSFLCSGEMWSPQVPVLAEHHRVLNIDLRGHGRSAPARAPFGIYDLVEDVLAVLDGEGIERAVWAGLSIGGMVALRAALVARDRVSGLVLLDTDAGSETAANRLKHPVMGTAAKVFGIRPLAPAIVRLFFSPETRRTNAPLIDEWRERFSSVHVPSMLRTMDALRRRDSVLDRLGEIDVPALVMVGERDSLLPPSRSEDIAARLKDASLVFVEAAGHLTTLERPEVVNAAMSSFLGQRLGQGS